MFEMPVTAYRTHMPLAIVFNQASQVPDFDVFCIVSTSKEQNASGSVPNFLPSEAFDTVGALAFPTKRDIAISFLAGALIEFACWLFCYLAISDPESTERFIEIWRFQNIGVRPALSLYRHLYPFLGISARYVAIVFVFAVLIAVCSTGAFLVLAAIRFTSSPTKRVSAFPHWTSFWWIVVLLLLGWGPLFGSDLYEWLIPPKSRATSGLFAVAWRMTATLACTVLLGISAIVQLVKFLARRLNLE